MKVTQIYEILNDIHDEILGKAEVAIEDLQGIIDMGKEILDNEAVEPYSKSLINHIGKMVFVNRPYAGRAPRVLMDAWEFGSVLEKVQMELPKSQANQAWDLVEGKSYDPNVFYKPTITAKFYNERITFEVAMSFTEDQIKQSFTTLEQMNSFLSMIYTAIENRITLDVDALVMRTINNFIGETLANEFPEANYGSSSTGKAVNLLKLYNAQKEGAALLAEKALKDLEFLKFAAFTMGLTSDRMSVYSTLFNIGKKARFTPHDLQRVVLLADFAKAADVYLQSDTFHNEFTKFPVADTVPFWQGSGVAYDFGEVSEINITTSSGKEVNASGILGVIFDRDALGVSNVNRKTTTDYNPVGEFVNNWYKYTAGYFNDTNENFVVFYIADEA